MTHTRTHVCTHARTEAREAILITSSPARQLSQDWTPFRAFPDEVLCLAGMRFFVERGCEGREHCVVVQGDAGTRRVLSLASAEEATRWLGALERAASLVDRKADAAPAATDAGTSHAAPAAASPRPAKVHSADGHRTQTTATSLRDNLERRAQLAARLSELQAETLGDRAQVQQFEEQCRAVRNQAAALLAAP